MAMGILRNLRKVTNALPEFYVTLTSSVNEDLLSLTFQRLIFLNFCHRDDFGLRSTLRFRLRNHSPAHPLHRLDLPGQFMGQINRCRVDACMTGKLSPLWNSFNHFHHNNGLPGELEIPMESFARAVEIVLKESELRDASGFRPEKALWDVTVRSCGYIQSRQAVSAELASATH